MGAGFWVVVARLDEVGLCREELVDSEPEACRRFEVRPAARPITMVRMDITENRTTMMGSRCGLRQFLLRVISGSPRLTRRGLSGSSASSFSITFSSSTSSIFAYEALISWIDSWRRCAGSNASTAASAVRYREARDGVAESARSMQIRG